MMALLPLPLLAPAAWHVNPKAVPALACGCSVNREKRRLLSMPFLMPQVDTAGVGRTLIVTVWSLALATGMSAFDLYMAGKVYAASVLEYGATPNDSSDDTAGFVQALAANAEVTAPSGTFRVKNLQLSSGKTLRGSGAATVLKLPEGQPYMTPVINVADGASDVRILDLTVDGNRSGQELADEDLRGRTAPGVVENGGMHGVRLGTRAGRIQIHNVTARNNWTDGFYLGVNVYDVTITNAVADNNRRQGMSTRGMRNVVIRDTTFKNTNGRFPGAGIDIETEKTNEHIANVVLKGITYSGNWGRGLVIDHKGGDVVSVLIEDSIFLNNGLNSDNNAIVFNGRGRGRDGVRASQFSNIIIRNNDISQNILLKPNGPGDASFRNIFIESNRIQGRVKTLYMTSADSIVVRNNCIEGGLSGDGIAASNNSTDCENFLPIECHVFESGASVPAGFGVPWNVLSAASELLLRATCTETSATLSVGTGSNLEYIHERGYRHLNGTWQPFAFTGENRTGPWLIGKAEATVERSLVVDFFVAQVCIRIEESWKCGCRDSECAQRFWQLQGFSPNVPH